MKITATMVTGKTVMIDVDPFETVGTVRNKVGLAFGLRYGQVRMVYDGALLVVDGMLISDLAGGGRSFPFVVHRVGAFVVYIEDLFYEDSLPIAIEVDSETTVQDALSENVNRPFGRQQASLYFRNQLMTSSRTIASYGVTPYSRLIIYN